MQRKRIAVVGSGIAGLSAAYLLSKDHDVTIYERTSTLGMDSHGIDVDVGLGEKRRVDMPLRVFTESYYPNLTSLYDEVGVEYAPENYSGSFSSLSGECFFRYQNLVLGQLSIPYILSCNPFNFTFMRIVFDLLRFLYRTPKHFRSPALANKTLQQYVEEENYSKDFVDKMLVPTLSGICTCSYEAVRNYPANIIVDYMVTRSMYGVRRATGGAREVVAKLSENCKSIKLNTVVRSLTHLPESKQVAIVSEAQHGDGSSLKPPERLLYDQVIISTQANQAISLLSSSENGASNKTFAELVDVLRAFRYEKSQLVLHTDTRLMPLERGQWKPVNFLLSDKNDAAMASIWMNKVQRNLGNRVQLFQTWNPLLQPAPETVLCEGSFERPVVDAGSIKAMTALKELQGRNGIWCCGSYAEMGVPLLETAVTSAVFVARGLGVDCPWGARPPMKRRHVLLAPLFFIVLFLFSIALWSWF